MVPILSVSVYHFERMRHPLGVLKVIQRLTAKALLFNKGHGQDCKGILNSIFPKPKTFFVFEVRRCSVKHARMEYGLHKGVRADECLTNLGELRKRVSGFQHSSRALFAWSDSGSDAAINPWECRTIMVDDLPRQFGAGSQYDDVEFSARHHKAGLD